LEQGVLLLVMRNANVLHFPIEGYSAFFSYI